MWLNAKFFLKKLKINSYGFKENNKKELGCVSFGFYAVLLSD
jgi:hypothetical protein